VLPGLDDGPATLEEAVGVASAAAAAGTREIVATPHLNEEYAPSPEEIRDAAERLRAGLAAEAVPLTLHLGAEIAVPQLLALDAEGMAARRLGGGPWLLVEAPLSPSAGDIEGPLHDLLRSGERLAIAHPERSPLFQHDPAALGRLVGAGAIGVITASAIVGRFGRTAKRFAIEMLRDGLGHALASDAHDLAGRSPGLREGAEALAHEAPELADRLPWLTQRLPAALLAGRPLPAPPPPAELEPRRGWWRRLTRSPG
jgi:protein-tyrosine phosphatase